MPIFKHDCSGCKFLASGKYQEKECDVYVCGEKNRSIIIRFSDKGSDYCSSPLFSCCELTELDKVALINGLELTEYEEKKFLGVLVEMWRFKLSYSDYKQFYFTEPLGKGNIAFKEF